MKLYKYLKKAKWKDDLYVDVRIQSDIDDEGNIPCVVITVLSD